MTKVNEGRPGYKETKIGWIPEEWNTKRLKDVTKIVSGTTPYRGEYVRYFKDGIHPWVKTTDLNNREIVNTEECITDIALIECSCKLLPIDTVFVAMYGGFKQIGRTGILKKRASCNQALSAMFPSKNHHSEYLLHYLNGEINRWRNYAASSRKDPNITKGDVRAFIIAIPPLSEQKKIAEILSTWDEAIEKLEKLIELKEKRKKGLMNELFTGKRRLPGFGFPTNSNNIILDGWKKIKLKDIAIDITRKNNGESSHVLTASGTNGLVDQKEYFKRNVSGENLSNYYLLKKNEFAYNRSSMKGYPFGAIKILDKYDAGVLSTLYICFAIDESNVNLAYIDEYFESGLCNIELNGRVQVGARAHGLLNISKADFYGINLIIPPLKEQQEIVNIIKTFRADLSYLKKTLENIKSQKRGLMQKLLTGEIRVKV
ncbi:MAG: restriction endonuclease subunit S [Spirochaetales bacterium]|uniref:Restriction endonuclease subunit S n=1 Tax=Candidatus Thalassospirochaeta sargassi TaxID=3119039 RepID=A0AAJ1MJX3_9SPIO|nr:restriction endonuclease subunit S [Spirochaetales bacterium]